VALDNDQPYLSECNAAYAKKVKVKTNILFMVLGFIYRYENELLFCVRYECDFVMLML